MAHTPHRQFDCNHGASGGQLKREGKQERGRRGSSLILSCSAAMRVYFGGEGTFSEIEGLRGEITGDSEPFVYAYQLGKKGECPSDRPDVGRIVGSKVVAEGNDRANVESTTILLKQTTVRLGTRRALNRHGNSHDFTQSELVSELSPLGNTVKDN